jgi:hypothetical protein
MMQEPAQVLHNQQGNLTQHLALQREEKYIAKDNSTFIAIFHCF